MFVNCAYYSARFLGTKANFIPAHSAKECVDFMVTIAKVWLMLRNESKLLNNSRVKVIFSCSPACVQLAAPSPQKKIREGRGGCTHQAKCSLHKRNYFSQGKDKTRKRNVFPHPYLSYFSIYVLCIWLSKACCVEVNKIFYNFVSNGKTITSLVNNSWSPLAKDGPLWQNFWMALSTSALGTWHGMKLLWA